MTGANLRIAEHQGGIEPAPLHGICDMLGDVGNGGRTPRQPIQRSRNILRQGSAVDAEMANYSV